MAKPVFNRCPLCGNSISEELVHNDNGFFMVSCFCGCQFSPGVTSIQELSDIWNNRSVPDETVQMVIDSELSTSRSSKGSLLKSATFFYWLSCVFFALRAFFLDSEEPSFFPDPSGLSGCFYVLGLYCLGYGFWRFLNSSRFQEIIDS